MSCSLVIGIYDDDGKKKPVDWTWTECNWNEITISAESAPIHNDLLAARMSMLTIIFPFKRIFLLHKLQPKLHFLRLEKWVFSSLRKELLCVVYEQCHTSRSHNIINQKVRFKVGFFLRFQMLNEGPSHPHLFDGRRWSGSTNLKKVENSSS